MTLPLTKAQQLDQEHGATLADHSVSIPPFTLRVWIQKFKAALPDATAVESGALHNMIGLAWARLQNHDEALRAYRNARRADPSAAVYSNNIAATLVMMGRPSEALAELAVARKAPSRAPRLQLLLWGNEAEAHHGLGNAAASIDAMEQALACADPASPLDSFLLAMNFALIGRDDDAVEFLARHLAVALGTARGDVSAVDFVRASPPEALRSVDEHPALLHALERAIARADGIAPPADASTAQETMGLPRTPTSEEIAAATEDARDEDGIVDPFALAEALAVPMRGAIRADDRHARFAGDGQVARLITRDA